MYNNYTHNYRVWQTVTKEDFLYHKDERKMDFLSSGPLTSQEEKGSKIEKNNQMIDFCLPCSSTSDLSWGKTRGKKGMSERWEQKIKGSSSPSHVLRSFEMARLRLC